jgi:hypothetical protein
VNLREGFLDIHVRESHGGDYAIKTFIAEWKRFADTLKKSSPGKSHSGSRQTAFIEIKSGNFVGSGNTPGGEVAPWTAT